MFPMKDETHPIPTDEDPIRAHTFDGIREYDKRLPNWWLWTLYGAIIYAFAYWFYYHFPTQYETSEQRVEKKINAIAVAAAKNSGADLSDDQLWAMSKDPAVVNAGAMTFQTTCASCHMPDLSGKIGPNLKDNIWVHGGKPTDIIHTITTGVAAKGMPTWGPVLGPAKISEVAAFILSYHNPADPVLPANQATTATTPPVTKP
jgi:cytochrome c oxidase cbb3-type subunit 3